MVTATAPTKAKKAPLTEAEKAQRATAKAAKLKELGSKRVDKTLKAIQMVGNLGTYGPTDEQRAKVFAALSEALKVAHARWQGKKEAGDRFQL